MNGKRVLTRIHTRKIDRHVTLVEMKKAGLHQICKKYGDKRSQRRHQICKKYGDKRSQRRKGTSYFATHWKEAVSN